MLAEETFRQEDILRVNRDGRRLHQDISQSVFAAATCLLERLSPGISIRAGADGTPRTPNLKPQLSLFRNTRKRIEAATS